MLLLISKKKEEGLHIVRIEDVILYGFRKMINPRFNRELDDSPNLNLSYFLNKSTNFRTETEEFNLNIRPVLKSYFVYFAEKIPKVEVTRGKG
jgi:hypothetical protein